MHSLFSLSSHGADAASTPPGTARAALRYRSVCPCCVEEVRAEPGKPQRRPRHRPVLPWRLRLEQQQDRLLL